MKRQLTTIIVSVVLVAALTLTYFIVQNKRASDELANAEDPTLTSTEAEPIVLIDKSKSDIEKVVIENEKGVMTFIPKVKTDENDTEDWVLTEYPELPLTNYSVSSIMTSFYYLSPSEKLVDNADNPSEFGFDSPAVATATYNDGSTEKILVGNKTPTGDFYYIMREGDPAVYLLIETYGDRFYSGYNEIAKKSMDQINLSTLYYVYVSEKDNTELELVYSGNKEEFVEEIETAGSAFIDMTKPYDDKTSYPSYFTEHINTTFTNYSLGDLVEVNCTDLSKYGLDDPELTIILEDTDLRLHLLVGDYAPAENESTAGTEFVYVCYGDTNNVFLMSARYLEAFRNLNPLKYVERFVILPNITTVNEIKITSDEFGRSNHILLNHEAEQPDIENDVIHPTVDGKEVDESSFRTYYRTLIGLSIDTEIKDYTITEKPLVEVTYVYNTSSNDSVVRFYPYNDNFYAVQVDDQPVKFLVNKQSMKTMYNYLDGLFTE